jgi:hypothetical protein
MTAGGVLAGNCLAREALSGRERLSLGERGSLWAREALSGRERLSLGERGSLWAREALSGRERLSLGERGSPWAREALSESISLRLSLGERLAPFGREALSPGWLCERQACGERFASGRQTGERETTMPLAEMLTRIIPLARPGPTTPRVRRAAPTVA